MSQLPKDPMILLSYVNTELRDSGDSLEEFCVRMDVEHTELEKVFDEIGFRYDEKENRFH
ncbi:MAG: DUF4250 domain-containing protein [Oscillospiraceae bacterium]|nr:DUF4250 domain-containing protein [Oscillospiraceae bacterium]